MAVDFNLSHVLLPFVDDVVSKRRRGASLQHPGTSRPGGTRFVGTPRIESLVA